MGGLWRVSAVTKMMAAGGTTKYWRKMFSPPEVEKMVASFACYLTGQTELVPGVLFVGSLSIAWASDSIQQESQQYMKVCNPTLAGDNELCVTF